jgi:hypothetical protein
MFRIRIFATIHLIRLSPPLFSAPFPTPSGTGGIGAGRPGGQILLPEHLRNGRRRTGTLIGFFNLLAVRLPGPNIENHLPLEMIEQAGFRVESIKHPGNQGIVKVIAARPGEDQAEEQRVSMGPDQGR